MAKDLKKLRQIAERTQARADKAKARYHIEEAAQEESARKEIGETTLALLQTMTEALRDPFVERLAPALSNAALDLLVREDMMSLDVADGIKADRVAAKQAKKKPNAATETAIETNSSGA